MRISHLRLLVFLLFVTVVKAQDGNIEILLDMESQTSVPVSGCRYRFGDDSNWSSPDFDDSDWPDVFQLDLSRAKKGIHWFRQNITLKGDSAFQKPFYIRVAYLQAAYDLFWDGVKVGSNGRVGLTQEEEIPGQTIFVVQLDPAAVSEGTHTVSIRVSNMNAGVGFAMGSMVISNDPVTIHLYRYDWLFRQAFFIGAFLTATIVGFALFWGGGRYRPYLIFALISLVTTLYRGFLFFLEYKNLPSTALKLVRIIHPLFFDIIMLGILVFIVLNFRIHNKKYHFAAGTLFIIVFNMFRLNGLTQLPLNLIPLFFWSIYPVTLLGSAIHKKKAGSLFALIGYILFLTPQISFRFNIQLTANSFMYAYLLFILAIILSISRQLNEQANQQKILDLKSQRLENELLKKSIQPHFMMNTLQSIQSLSKRDPEKASALIEAFGDEFRVINKSASEKTITMTQEIQLCESHLKLMGYRWNSTFRLSLEGIQPQEKIPPLIFHTLIENGLTHSYKPRENGTFHLVRLENIGSIIFQLRNDGSLLRKRPNHEQYGIEEGMGFKYVKSRLEESFPGRWHLAYGLKRDHWEVTIELKKR